MNEPIVAICRCYHIWAKRQIGHHCWTCGSDIIAVEGLTTDRQVTWYLNHVPFKTLREVYQEVTGRHLTTESPL